MQIQKSEWYKSFEEGIQTLLQSLHHLGIDTIWSCEGHIREKWYFTGVLPWPWVVIHCRQRELESLLKILALWNKEHPDKTWILSSERIHGSLTPKYLQSEYCGIVRALTPKEENSELSQDVLIQLQEDASILAKYLQQQQPITP